MKIWLRSYPLFCDPPVDDHGKPLPEWIPCCTNDAGTVNYGDDTSGDVVSVQPDGRVDRRVNGTTGVWEQQKRDASVNVLVYSGTGVPYRVPYRAR